VTREWTALPLPLFVHHDPALARMPQSLVHPALVCDVRATAQYSPFLKPDDTLHIPREYMLMYLLSICIYVDINP